jgi:hypothetical protein
LLLGWWVVGVLPHPVNPRNMKMRSTIKGKNTKVSNTVRNMKAKSMKVKSVEARFI